MKQVVSYEHKALIFVVQRFAVQFMLNHVDLGVSYSLTLLTAFALHWFLEAENKQLLRNGEFYVIHV